MGKRIKNPYHLRLLLALIRLKRKGSHTNPITIEDRGRIKAELKDCVSNRTLDRFFSSGSDDSGNYSETTLNIFCSLLKKGYSWSDFLLEHPFPFKEPVQFKSFYNLSDRWKKNITGEINKELNGYTSLENYLNKKKGTFSFYTVAETDRAYRENTESSSLNIFSKINLPELQTKLPIIKVRSIDINQLPKGLSTAIIMGKRFDIEKELDFYYNGYRKRYRESGNPILVYNEILSFISLIETLLNYSPVQIGKYHWFMSYLLINSDFSKDVLEQARVHAEKSIAIFANLNLYVQEVHGYLIKAYWLRALTFKMEGKLNFAHELLEDTIQELDKERLGGYFTNLYLHRQQVLIEDKKESYNRLLDGMSNYKHNAIESYYSSKRIFEFTLYSKDEKNFDIFFQLSRHYYNLVSSKLEQVYKFSYWKYVYVYLSYKKKKPLAARIYNYLLNGTNTQQLYGQQRSLIELHKMLND